MAKKAVKIRHLASVLADTQPRFVEDGIDVQTGEMVFDFMRVEESTVQLALTRPQGRETTKTAPSSVPSDVPLTPGNAERTGGSRRRSGGGAGRAWAWPSRPWPHGD